MIERAIGLYLSKIKELKEGYSPDYIMGSHRVYRDTDDQKEIANMRVNPYVQAKKLLDSLKLKSTIGSLSDKSNPDKLKKQSTPKSKKPQ